MHSHAQTFKYPLAENLHSQACILHTDTPPHTHTEGYCWEDFDWFRNKVAHAPNGTSWGGEAGHRIPFNSLLWVGPH